MRYESKPMKRIGDVFENQNSTVSYDLSGLRFLHCGVDTIKQLFDCVPREDVLDKLANHYDDKKTDLIVFGEHAWRFSRAGKTSGYQYLLKNLEIGFVVLLKSFYHEADKQGPHLKIEVTPESVERYGLNRLTKELHKVGSLFADSLIASGVAVHMALDMKGLELPEDFEQRLVTRAQRQLKVTGISNAAYDARGAAFIYGQNQTYMFGSASGLQFCCYDKTEEVNHSDKIDFWEDIWKRTPSAENPEDNEYKRGDQVHRVEFRFSHRIIKEFENGNLLKTGEYICIREPRDLTKHLRGLWLYALNNFRLQHSTTYMHPIWQKLIEDIQWQDIHPDFVYSRAQKIAQTDTSKRNVAMFIGNYLKLAARKGLKPEVCVKHILSAGLDSDVAQYFGLLLYGNSSELESMLMEFVEEKLIFHRMNGVGTNQSINAVPF
ncbi:MAG: hypothetical protein LRY66_08485 [Saccharospirillaceae bacterium]|nr:hypothetical protein [Saccharospirillaceae bacterium]MCD8531386.1 hypothetical protein [Saccharospirillaceae bacterium]